MREIIEFKTDCVIVGEDIDGLQAVRLPRSSTDIAVVDISMPGLDGLDVGPPDSYGEPQTTILILTMHEATPVIAKIQRCSRIFAEIRGAEDLAVRINSHTVVLI